MPGVFVWEYDAANKVWVPKPAVVPTKRMTATGQVISGAHKLYWLHENPSGGSGLYELSDATSGGATVVFDHFSTNREGHMVSFDPPMNFSNGIYLETFSALTSVVFGYV